MTSIEITLTNGKLRKYYLISRILAFINLVTQVFLTFTPEYQQYWYIIAPLAAIGIIYLVSGKPGKFDLRDKKQYIGVVYILIVAIWLIWKIYWLSGLMAFFYLMYSWSVRKFDVFISADKIIYPSFPKKVILWNELQNLVIKDGILTIDFKNDKLLQNDVEEGQAIDEKKINEFCRIQLEK